jgi:thymidylate synthase (FAD)
MRIIRPYYVIETKNIDGGEIRRRIERYGRVCYKSEGKITDDSAGKFVRMILKRGHESVIEHESLTVRFVCDRGVSHELVRHRLASFSQESTRYCNYGKQGGEITFIYPPWLDYGDAEGSKCWKLAMGTCESVYLKLLSMGHSPQEARSVLPNSLKTEIVVTANLREWRHILRLRCSKAAHPQMREIMVPLLEELQDLIPVIFDDLEVE